MDKDPGFAKEKEAGAILNRVLAARARPSGCHPLSDPQLRLSGACPPRASGRPALRRNRPGLAACPAHALAHLRPARAVGRGDRIEPGVGGRLPRLRQGPGPGRFLERAAPCHGLSRLCLSSDRPGRRGRAGPRRAERDPARRRAHLHVAYAATAIPARLALERRRWKEAASLDLAGQCARARPARRVHMGRGACPFRARRRRGAQRAMPAAARVGSRSAPGDRAIAR